MARAPSDDRDSRDDRDSFGAPSHDETFDEVVRALAHAPPRPPPADPENGAHWGERGRYVIERCLGRGGMGTVFLASDSLLGRRVALKVLDATDLDDAAQRGRLMREARMAAALEHERIARVYDVAEHDGSMFVAMEYIRGVTLRAWMREAHDPSEILRIGIQIAEGLRALHASGVMHRDLKPENVMLQLEGGVKLLDFGLAGNLGRPLESQSHLQSQPSSGEAVVFSSGSLSNFMGTPGYMAPEQYLGERADSRTDVFALGVTIHELVTGEKPFRGATVPSLLASIREHAVSFDGPAWSRFPAPLPRVVAKMLETDRAARYADGDEALRALHSATPKLDDRAPERIPSPPVVSQRALAFAFLAIVVGAAAVVSAPRARRAIALRRLLHRPPPAGMALVNEGTIKVGQSEEVVAKQCAEIGPECNPRLMHYQVPPVSVAVEPFYLDKLEVTNAELAYVLDTVSSSIFVEPDEDDGAPRYVRFNAGLGHSPDHLLDLKPPLNGIEYSASGFRAVPGREQWPAAQVTWFGASYYCGAVGKRLPAESEWEAAARGSDDRSFPWGSDDPRCGGVVVPSDGFVPMKRGCDKLASPEPVGVAPQDVTPQGIRGLAGNVSEWVASAFVEGDRRDLSGHAGEELPRVLRGGSFFFSLLARTSVRNKRPPGYVGWDLGFRCAANIPRLND